MKAKKRSCDHLVEWSSRNAFEYCVCVWKLFSSSTARRTRHGSARRNVAWQEENLTTKNYWFFLSELNELPGGWTVPVGYSTKDVFQVPNLGNPSPTPAPSLSRGLCLCVYTAAIPSRCVSEDEDADCPTLCSATLASTFALPVLFFYYYSVPTTGMYTQPTQRPFNLLIVGPMTNFGTDVQNWRIKHTASRIATSRCIFPLHTTWPCRIDPG